MEAQFKKKKRPAKGKKYKEGGHIAFGPFPVMMTRSMVTGIKPTNLTPVQARGRGAAKRGGNFKV